MFRRAPPAGRWPRPRRPRPGSPRRRTGGPRSRARRRPPRSRPSARASANQKKLPWASGHVPARAAQSGRDAVALGDQGVDPSHQLGLGLQRRDRGRLGDGRDAERQRHRSQGRGDVRLRDGVADPEPGQAVGLGEGAEQHHVGPAGEGRETVDRVGHPDELDVGLVDDRHHVVGDAGEERVELGLGDGRAGRVVGGADDHGPGAVGDGVGHGVEVVPSVLGDRHLHGRGRGGRHRDRVGLERAPGVDDLVTGIAVRREQLVDQRDRAGRGGEVAGRHPQARREGVVQRGAAHVRVAVHRLDGAGGGLDHAGQRRVGVLVGAELVGRHPRPDRRRLAGDVRRDGADVGAGLRAGHRSNLCRVGHHCRFSWNDPILRPHWRHEPHHPRLSELHDRYVEAINLAVAEDNLALVDELAASYDDEALDLIRRSAA